MYANSRPVSSTQSGPHPRLAEIVQRHLQHAYRRPVGTEARACFAGLVEQLRGEARTLVLDAGCGTGASSLVLARQHAHALVLGVDKSAARLATGQRLLARAGAPQNVRLLRMDLVDFWLLAAAAGLRLQRHYLLYPNPWPKPEHVQRRWAAHPVLPALLACGGALELRSNWETYTREFGVALELAGRSWHIDCLIGDEQTEAASPFEAKYRASGHCLWRIRADAPQP
jgi:tRNA (guanine-N7-)-methyltransferase